MALWPSLWKEGSTGKWSLAMRSLKRAIPQPIKDFLANYTRPAGSRKTITHHYLGEKIELVVKDDLTNGWYGHDWPLAERQEFLFLANLAIPPSGLIFDLGAHQGLVALLLKKKLVPEGRVVAVEIDRLNAEACNQNFRLNHENNITAVHGAVSDSCGMVQVNGRSNGRIVVKPSIFNVLYSKVSCLTIDRLTATYGAPDLVYLDVEGAEVLAMRGAGESLQFVPTWFIELHGSNACAQFGGSNAFIGRQFLSAGFALFVSEVQEKPFVRLVDIDELPSERCFLIASRKHG
jgi:FkbM family methyltransferase